MSNLNQKIAGLVLQNIEFKNDEAETLVEGVVTATADLPAAGIKFDALAGVSRRDHRQEARPAPGHQLVRQGHHRDAQSVTRRINRVNIN